MTPTLPDKTLTLEGNEMSETAIALSHGPYALERDAYAAAVLYLGKLQPNGDIIVGEEFITGQAADGQWYWGKEIGE